jgi:hypothetical protein
VRFEISGMVGGGEGRVLKSLPLVLICRLFVSLFLRLATYVCLKRSLKFSYVLNSSSVMSPHFVAVCLRFELNKLNFLPVPGNIKETQIMLFEFQPSAAVF